MGRLDKSALESRPKAGQLHKTKKQRPAFMLTLAEVRREAISRDELSRSAILPSTNESAKKRCEATFFIKFGKYKMEIDQKFT